MSSLFDDLDDQPREPDQETDKPIQKESSSMSKRGQDNIAELRKGPQAEEEAPPPIEEQGAPDEDTAEPPPQQDIIDMREGDSVHGVYALAGCELRDYHAGKFLTLKLGDRTGKVRGVMWEGGEQLYPSLALGDIVRIHGRVGTYQGARQIQLTALEKVTDLDHVDATRFLPSVTHDINELIACMRKIAQSIEDEHYRQLVFSFLDDDDFFGFFSQAPGGKQWHHAYLGGLLEHTVSMMQLAEFLCGHYINVNRDLVLAGTALHDIGKITEFEYRTAIGYSDEGRLLGHIVLGDEMVCRKAAEIEGFPREKLTLLRHLVLSHHGDKDQNSPRHPMTLEAMILHCCDYVDSQMSAFTREVTKAHELGKRWTDYVNLIGRYLYAGDPPEDIRCTPE